MKLTFSLLLMLLIGCTNGITSINCKTTAIEQITGDYKLSYFPEINNDWDYDDKQREEILSIRQDSSFMLKRIQPKGGFESSPQIGTWQIIDNQLILNSQRTFDIECGFISEPNCFERSDLSNVPWAKEL